MWSLYRGKDSSGLGVDCTEFVGLRRFALWSFSKPGLVLKVGGNKSVQIGRQQAALAMVRGQGLVYSGYEGWEF